MNVAGPLWLGRLFEGGFCTEMIDEVNKINLGTRKRVTRLLGIVLTELDASPTYYVVDRVCKKLRLCVPSKQRVTRRLVELGYKASLTHFNTMGIKTNASIEIVERVIRETL